MKGRAGAMCFVSLERCRIVSLVGMFHRSEVFSLGLGMVSMLLR